jgi:hypothetical protein
MQAISNALKDATFSKQLATKAGVQPNDFRPSEVREVRGTSLLMVIFAAHDQDTAERVASNAGPMLIRYFATNQPPVTTEFIDSYAQRVPRLWRRILGKWIP